MINKYLLTIESRKPTKQTRTETNHGNWKHFDGSQIRGGFGGMGEDVKGLRSTNR